MYGNEITISKVSYDHQMLNKQFAKCLAFNKTSQEYYFPNFPHKSQLNTFKKI